MESENKDIDFSKTILVDHFSRPYCRFVVQLVCSNFPGLFTFYITRHYTCCSVSKRSISLSHAMRPGLKWLLCHMETTFASIKIIDVYVSVISLFLNVCVSLVLC